MFGRPRESLRQLVRSQHEESMRYQEKRDEEFRTYAEEVHTYAKQSRACIAHLDQLREETREFNREMLLRNEKVYKAVIAQLEENTKQTRANTQAVLSVLDRLDGPGGLAA